MQVTAAKTAAAVMQNNARNLVPYLTALQNVRLPMIFDSEKKQKERALELLEIAGIAHKKNNKLSQLSGLPLWLHTARADVAAALTVPNVLPLQLQERYFDLPSQKPQNRPLWG